MNLYELSERTPQWIQSLTAVWEASVRATHHFLSAAEIERIREYVPQALRGVAHLIVAQREDGTLAGFMGAEGGRLEMLFRAPEERGKGLGKRLVQYGIQEYGVREVTVNEQNPQAVEFYKHLGFAEYARSQRDEQGGPYPILYLRRE